MFRWTGSVFSSHSGLWDPGSCSRGCRCAERSSAMPLGRTCRRPLDTYRWSLRRQASQNKVAALCSFTRVQDFVTRVSTNSRYHCCIRTALTHLQLWITHWPCRAVPHLSRSPVGWNRWTHNRWCREGHRQLCIRAASCSPGNTCHELYSTCRTTSWEGFPPGDPHRPSQTWPHLSTSSTGVPDPPSPHQQPYSLYHKALTSGWTHSIICPNCHRALDWKVPLTTETTNELCMRGTHNQHIHNTCVWSSYTHTDRHTYQQAAAGEHLLPSWLWESPDSELLWPFGLRDGPEWNGASALIGHNEEEELNLHLKHLQMVHINSWSFHLLAAVRWLITNSSYKHAVKLWPQSTIFTFF